MQPAVRRYHPVALLALALAVRLAVFATWQAWPGSQAPILDPAWHLGRALAVASGDWKDGDATWMVAPGPAYLFALARLLGGAGTAAPALVLIAVDLGVVEVVRRLGRRVGGDWTGLVAGLVAAVSAPEVFHDVTLLAVSPAELGLGGGLLLALGDEPTATTSAGATSTGATSTGTTSTGKLVLAGVALALGALFRPNLLLLAPVIALVAASGWWPDRRQAAKAAAIVVAGLALGLAPTTLRNGLVGGEWAPISANAGANLAMAQQPGLESNFPPPLDVPNNLDSMNRYFLEQASRDLGHDATPGEADRWWRDRAWKGIALDPGGAVRRTAMRFVLALSTIDVQDHYDYRTHRRDMPTLAWLPDFAFLLPGLALAGAVLGASAGRRREAAALAGTVLVFAASLAPFVVTERYRLPIHAALVPLAAWGLVRVVEERQAAWAVAAVAACFLFSVDPFGPRMVLPDAIAFGGAVSSTEASGVEREAAEAGNVGAAMLRNGDAEGAIPFLSKAVALRPSVTDSVSLGAALLKVGRTKDGLQTLLTVAKDHPKDADAVLPLCSALLAQDGMAEEAYQVCAQAANDAPQRWDTRYQFAMSQWKKGDLDDAIGNLERLSRERPGDAQIARALAGAKEARQHAMIER